MAAANLEYKSAPLPPFGAEERKVLKLDRTPYQANVAAPLPVTYVFDRKTRDAVSYEENVMAASDDLIDAKLRVSSAETDTKIARIEGKIETLAATLAGKIDVLHGDIRSLQSDIQKSDGYNRDTRLIVVSTVLVAAIALGGLMVAMATYGDAMFGRGMSVQDVVHAVAKEYATQAPANSPARR